MNKKILVNNSGITFVEIIISIAILSLFAVPIASSFLTTAKLNAQSKISLNVASISNKIIEGIGNEDIYPTTEEGNELTNEQYDKFEINRRIYTKITVKVGMDSESNLSDSFKFIESDGPWYRFNIDTSVDKMITFPEMNELSCPYVSDNPVVDVTVDDNGITLSGDVQKYIGGKKFGFFYINKSDKNVTLRLTNNSSKDNTVYEIDNSENPTNNVVISYLSGTKAWNVYNNLQMGMQYTPRKVAVAKIVVTVTVKDPLTGNISTYDMTVDKPVYNQNTL